MPQFSYLRNGGDDCNLLHGTLRSVKILEGQKGHTPEASPKGCLEGRDNLHSMGRIKER